MRFYEQVIKSRVSSLEVEKAERIVRLSMINYVEPKYESLSHLIRCALNKLVREEEQNLFSQKLREKQNGCKNFFRK